MYTDPAPSPNFSKYSFLQNHKKQLKVEKFCSKSEKWWKCDFFTDDRTHFFPKVFWWSRAQPRSHHCKPTPNFFSDPLSKNSCINYCHQQIVINFSRFRAGQVDGRVLVEMQTALQTVPEFFYGRAAQHLQLDFFALFRFMASIRALK